MVSSRFRLILIAGPDEKGRLDLDRIAAAFRGGVTLLQLRAKGAASGELLGMAREVLPLCRRAAVPLFINDRPDVALAAGADGVHLGPEDLPPAAAREVIGDLGLGVSARTPDRVREAEAARADYLGTGAVRASSSKPEAPVLGPDGVARIVASTSLPVVAVGGVLPGDCPGLRRRGAAGVAVLRGILDAPDPENAARAYTEAWGLDLGLD